MVEFFPIKGIGYIQLVKFFQQHIYLFQLHDQ
jgi:hypothetical protein